MTPVTDIPAPPARADDAHKGTFGTLLILGGSHAMIGAPMLAARSAYRGGVGLVQVAMPRPMLGHALTLLPEATGLPLDNAEADLDSLRTAAERATAFVVGPGLGQEEGADAWLDALLATDLPAVVDADGLNLLARRGAWNGRSAPTILTPHPGEMARLLPHVRGETSVPRDRAGRRTFTLKAAESLGAVLVLKGSDTDVSDGNRLYVNDTGDATLAKAGSGDVLAGLIGSLLAQGMPPFEAAVLGVHAHGLAGERVGQMRTTRGGLASEVADALPAVLAQLEARA